MWISITNVQPSTDPSQIEDIRLAYKRLRTTACANGQGGKYTQIHTMTDVIVVCPAPGMALPNLATVWLWAMVQPQYGQTIHGPAALSGTVWHGHDPPVLYGEFKTQISPVPPSPREVWTDPRMTSEFTRPHGPQMKLKFLSTGDTLDKWYTYWFVVLCVKSY